MFQFSTVLASYCKFSVSAAELFAFNQPLIWLRCLSPSRSKYGLCNTCFIELHSHSIVNG